MIEPMSCTNGTCLRVAVTLMTATWLALPCVAETEGFYLSTAIKLRGGTIPACTPLTMVDASKGKKIMLEDLGGAWGQFKVKATVLEAGRYSGLIECLVSTPQYADAYSLQELRRFDGSGLTAGMPHQFAGILLGPAVPRKKMSSIARDVLEWRPATGELQPVANISGVRSAAAWRLKAANSVSVYTGDAGEIRFMILAEDRSAPPDLSFLRGPIIDPLAHYAAGMTLYTQGQPEAAFDTWLPLADAGHAPAQYSLADLFYRGEGVEKDLETAVHWFQAAAKNSYPAAQYHLGYMYATGQGVTRDVVQAYRWMNAADKLGYEIAAEGRDRLAATMQPDERARAKQLLDKDEINNPVLLDKTAPEYPELARVVRSSGQVILQAMVDEKGVVQNAQIIRVDPTGLGFEDASIEAVMQWRYQPATLDGKPIEVYFTVVVDFMLR